MRSHPLHLPRNSRRRMIGFSMSKANCAEAAKRQLLDEKSNGPRLFALVTLVAFFPSGVAAQGPKLLEIEKNVELCNRVNAASVDAQIRGCSALIQSDGQTQKTIAVAHN